MRKNPHYEPEVENALEKNKEVTEEVKGAADELTVVHAVLSKDPPPPAAQGDTAQAIERTKELEERLTKSADKLTEVNETLARKVESSGST
jgi:hypothetical protein